MAEAGGARCPFGHGEAAPAGAQSSEADQQLATLSRTGSTNSTSSELHRTLDQLNLNNAPSVAPRSVAPSVHGGFRPPNAIAWLVGTWKGKGEWQTAHRRQQVDCACLSTPQVRCVRHV